MAYHAKQCFSKPVGTSLFFYELNEHGASMGCTVKLRFSRVLLIIATSIAWVLSYETTSCSGLPLLYKVDGYHDLHSNALLQTGSSAKFC
jgi:hypothetical protein